MALRFLHTTLLASLLSTALSQPSPSIPQDLTTGFTAKQLQVSFSRNAVNGFPPGTTFPSSAVANEPTFALGDSNGISPSTRYTLIMLDATCPDSRTLHYARSNFQFAFAGGTNIETASPPLMPYAAPGAFGELGDARQYVFLMYTNPKRREVGELKMPARGEGLDVKTFQSENGLGDPVAGVDMVVQLGGEAACEGGGTATSAVVSSTGRSSSGGEVTTSTVRSSGVGEVVTSNVRPSGVSSAPASTPTLASAEQSIDDASSTLQTAPPTTTPSSVRASATLSPTTTTTTSGGLLEQTANAGGRVRGVFAVPCWGLVVVGLLW